MNYLLLLLQLEIFRLEGYKVVNHALALNISAFSEAGAHLSLAVRSCFIHVTLHIVSSSHMVLGLT